MPGIKASWEGYPLNESPAPPCERCGLSPATYLCFDHEVPHPPRSLRLCGECESAEHGRRMAIGLRQYLRGFPEHPTDDDFRALTLGNFLGEDTCA